MRLFRRATQWGQCLNYNTSLILPASREEDQAIAWNIQMIEWLEKERIYIIFMTTFQGMN